MDNNTIQAYINSHLPQIQSILAGAEEQLYNLLGIDVTIGVLPSKPPTIIGVEGMIKNAAAKLCKVWGVGVAAVFNGTRKRELVAMRQIIYHYIKHKHPAISYAAIGEHLGGYDHSTIMFNIERANELMANNDELFYTYLTPVINLYEH